MTFFSNNLNSNVNNNIIPLPMSFAQDAQGRNYFFVGTIPQIPMIPQPAPVAPIMVTPIPQPLQAVEEDDECCFYLTEKGIHNDIMGTPLQPQKKSRSYGEGWPQHHLLTMHQCQYHSKPQSSIRKGPWNNIRISWWLGQLSR
jgi:hypothetical protein